MVFFKKGEISTIIIQRACKYTNRYRIHNNSRTKGGGPNSNYKSSLFIQNLSLCLGHVPWLPINATVPSLKIFFFKKLGLSWYGVGVGKLSVDVIPPAC